MEPDRTTIAAEEQDISFVTVSVIDENGNLCPMDAEQLQFTVKEAGTYLAACNDDATSLEPFHLPTMKTFNGKLVVLVQSSKGKEISNYPLIVKT